MRDIITKIIDKFNAKKRVIITEPKRVLKFIEKCDKMFMHVVDGDTYHEPLTGHASIIYESRDILFAWGHHNLPQMYSDECDFTPDQLKGLTPDLWAQLHMDLKKNSYWYSSTDTEKFNRIMGFTDQVDGYGTTDFLKIDGHILRFFNTYGEEDNYPPYTIYTTCFLNHDAKELWVFDVFYDTKLKTIVPKNLTMGKIPDEIYYPFIGVGKRAFYYNRRKRQVSLRYNSKEMPVIKNSHHHCKRSEKWVSGPRCIIQCTTTKF